MRTIIMWLNCFQYNDLKTQYYYKVSRQYNGFLEKLYFRLFIILINWQL